MIDPAVGFVMRVRLGDKVRAGDPLAVVYARKEDDLAQAEQSLRSAVHISDGLLMALFIYGEVTVIYALWVQLQGKAMWVYVGNVVMVVVALGYSLWRYGKGGIAKTPYRTILGETNED